VIRLYFDEDNMVRSLIQALRQRGVDITTVQEQGLRGAADAAQLDVATRLGRVVITTNVRDCTRLHAVYMTAGRHHTGIVAIHQQRYTVGERLRRLLASGGFPEAFLNPDEAARLRNDRMEIVTREDLRDLSRVTSWRGPADLIELLRERVGKPTNYDNLAQSLGISPPTAKSWVELLEKLYVVFLLPPYSSSLSRSIRKDRRVFFYDCAAAYDEAGGAQLENLVACSLLKYTQFRKDAAGENWELYYLRDKVDRGFGRPL